MLRDKHVLLGVTGGIAAYKSAALVSILKKRGAAVKVVMTENACRFITPLTFEALSGNEVYVHSFEHEYDIHHISLAKWSDVCVIAPASANMIAKAACGIADDLLSTTLLALTCPLLIAPAMNTNMWAARATQDNIRTLLGRGVSIIGPGTGKLACGDSGVGRMSEPEEIADAIEKLFSSFDDLAGLKIMVTAGPTIEKIDPVRYITNRSTGKMGYAIARAAARRGADVVLVSGPVSLTRPEKVELVSITSSSDLYREVVSRAPACDIVIQAAAPADFTPAQFSDTKIKKGGDTLTLTLTATKDIAREIGANKRPGQTLVAFAAETDHLIENAAKKLVTKSADLVVANNVAQPGAGFGVDTNRVTFVTAEGCTELPLASKDNVADAILDKVMEIRHAGQRPETDPETERS